MSSNDPQTRYRLAGALYRQSDFSGALEILDALIESNPQAAPLHWHRSRCLIALERPDEARDALETTLQLIPDFAPALLARVDLAQNQGEELDVLPLLQRAAAAEPDNARAQFLLAEAELAQADMDSPAEHAALARLDRSLELDPAQAPAWACRAEARLQRALITKDSQNTVIDPQGLRYDRNLLEQALNDYQHAATLQPSHLFDRRVAMIADRLGRYALAAEALDRTLARMPEDALLRPFVQQERDRYAQGQSATADLLEETPSHATMADLLEEAASHVKDERNLEEDMAYALTQGMAILVRDGADVQSAMDTLLGDQTQEDLIATSIAFNIYNYVNEPDPELEEVNLSDYPRYQRRHVAACARQLAPLGYFPLAHAEARGLTRLQGTRTLIGLFVHPEYGAAAAFAMRPKWPGMLGFLRLLLSGQWKTARLLTCSTSFSDGSAISSCITGPDVFDNSGIEQLTFERLPDGTPPAEVAESHLALVQARIAAGAQPLALRNLQDIEKEWRRGNAIKAAYRKRIGYVTDAELHAMLGSRYEVLADKIRSRLARLDSQPHGQETSE